MLTTKEDNQLNILALACDPKAPTRIANLLMLNHILNSPPQDSPTTITFIVKDSIHQPIISAALRANAVEYPAGHEYIRVRKED